ncbi:short-chain dehydrogenase/reductase (SDR) family protein [Tieghemostelium lacteum]|uniref:Short-chain dehydrogenase/reductase (SDR) family protein n=1 Tax=Tieghemostelium lacteum TaxID=361077 RepID=A0A151Z5V0_TIELA|nr:short-chain dehydrogenase/reductase (SDR) family protein [Tieghemostelium lacteum]|eukprot:KYQ89333.1 short-chain dehydrogenase/reductase (SDR) family protein [Tieghemostelium lacteum]
MDRIESNNKVWFVTGASSGIGLELVKSLVEKGYSVAGTSRKLSNLKDKIANERFLPLEVDLANESSVEDALKKTVEKFGKLDVVVNNAGQAVFGALEEFSDSELRNIFDSNYFGPLNVIRHSLKYLRPQGHGLIYNVSSIAGFIGNAQWGAYASTKFALTGASEALAAELKPLGIQVVSVNPGMVDTPIHNYKPFTKITIPEYKSKEKIDNFYKYRYSIRSTVPYSDPIKLSNLLIDLSNQTDIPVNLFCGVDSIHTAKDKLSNLSKDITSYEKSAGADILESNKN